MRLVVCRNATNPTCIHKFVQNLCGSILLSCPERYIKVLLSELREKVAMKIDRCQIGIRMTSVIYQNPLLVNLNRISRKCQGFLSLYRYITVEEPGGKLSWPTSTQYRHKDIYMSLLNS
jgi:hypothetical protein